MPRQDAELDEVCRIAHAIVIFGDPEERVQVAQAPFSFLDVRLDQIARVTGLLLALVALGELGGDAFRSRARAHFRIHAFFPRGHQCPLPTAAPPPPPPPPPPPLHAPTPPPPPP